MKTVAAVLCCAVLSVGYATTYPYGVLLKVTVQDGLDAKQAHDIPGCCDYEEVILTTTPDNPAAGKLPESEYSSRNPVMVFYDCEYDVPVFAVLMRRCQGLISGFSYVSKSYPVLLQPLRHQQTVVQNIALRRLPTGRIGSPIVIPGPVTPMPPTIGPGIPRLQP